MCEDFVYSISLLDCVSPIVLQSKFIIAKHESVLLFGFACSISSCLVLFKNTPTNT